MSVTIRTENFKFEGKAFSEKFNKALEGLFIEAARAFLIASTRRIPIRTGFLRGAFSRLEDVVGAFEASSSRVKLGAKKTTTSHLERGENVIAHRIARLRDRQQRLLNRIERAQGNEIARRERFQEELRRINDKHSAELKPGTKAEVSKQLREQRTEKNKVFSENRRAAIIERRHEQSLLKLARDNETKLSSSVAKYAERIGKEFRAAGNDSINKVRLRAAEAQSRKSIKFQRKLTRLKKLYFGKKGGFTGKATQPFGERTKGTIGTAEYNRRLDNLREAFNRQNNTQKRLQARLQKLSVGRFATKNNQKKIAAFRAKVAKRHAEALKQAQKTFNEEKINEIKRLIDQETARGVQAAINRRLKGGQLLHTLQQRLVDERRVTKTHKLSLERLRQQLNLNEGQLNIVAWTSSGRIVGQNQPGRFNLGHGETVKKIFNELGGQRREEFYYPVKGSKTRILKTPRSGRRFATPSNLIIQKIERAASPNLGAFQQLAGFRSAAGLSTSDLNQQIAGMREAVQGYVFHFAIDISYLPVNEVKQAWFAWQAGIHAFNQVIASKGPSILPEFSKFLLVEQRRVINEGNASVTIRRNS